jgi:uncharacterized protein with von Willebrand factor type A (vWA) domain
MFLVDGSGSMNGNKIKAAMSFALSIAEAPLDDLQISITMFGSNVRRWEGTRDINPQTGEVVSRVGWSLMPSRDNLERASEWMAGHFDGGSTYVIPGLRHILKSCSNITDDTGPQLTPGIVQPVEDLTILILTDGVFTDNGAGIVGAIETLQQERVDNGLEPAAIGIIGIDVRNNAKAHLAMTQIANTSNLGYLRLTIIRDDENDK